MMNRNLVAVSVAALLLLLAGPFAAAGHHYGEDRELHYLGGTIETGVTPRTIHAVCDDAVPVDGFHGLSGGVFCSVPVGSRITVTVHDDSVGPAEAVVTCPRFTYHPIGAPFAVHKPSVPELPGVVELIGHEVLGVAAPSFTEVVWSLPCLELPYMGSGFTDIAVFPSGDATLGRATLEFEFIP